MNPFCLLNFNYKSIILTWLFFIIANPLFSQTRSIDQKNQPKNYYENEYFKRRNSVSFNTTALKRSQVIFNHEVKVYKKFSFNYGVGFATGLDNIQVYSFNYWMLNDRRNYYLENLTPKRFFSGSVLEMKPKIYFNNKVSRPYIGFLWRFNYYSFNKEFDLYTSNLITGVTSKYQVNHEFKWLYNTFLLNLGYNVNIGHFLIDLYLGAGLQFLKHTEYSINYEYDFYTEDSFETVSRSGQYGYVLRDYSSGIRITSVEKERYPLQYILLAAQFGINIGYCWR